LTAGDQGLRALLLGGLPLRESVAAGGPFVMNTQQELHDAFTQLRSRGERFGL
jgi:redox-sensitive bicupin YhaK (pirin superfamily)